MSYTRFGRYPTNVRDYHTQARVERRQSYLARGRTIPLNPAVAAEVVNMAAASAAAPNAVATVANNAALNLPVPKKKKKFTKVTRKTLLRDVQTLKNKLNKRELKAMGISYGDQAIYTYSESIPLLTATNPGSIFISQPCQQVARAPLLTQGTGNGERIGDKVYYVTARYRLCFRMDVTPFVESQYARYGSIPSLPITGTPTTSVWTGTYTSVFADGSHVVADGITLPIRIVSLAIREDYMNSILVADPVINRDRLRLADIFTNMNDWDGNGGIDNEADKIWLYSRKVKNEAAGKVRVKSDNIYYLSSSASPCQVVVFDKNVPIRQQYSFEQGKTDGWVHGVLIHVPSILELKKFMAGNSSINWTTFNKTKPVVKMQGGACYYYYDD